MADSTSQLLNTQHTTTHNCLTKCSLRIQTSLDTVFGKIGEIVGTYPWHTIFCSLLFSFTFGIGFIGWTTEYRVTALWIPPDSQAVHENDWIINTFGYETRTTQILQRPTNTHETNVLTPEYIEQFWIAHYLMINTSTKAPQNYRTQFPDLYSFDGYNNSVPICFRRGIDCQMDTILDLFGYEYTDIMSLTQDTILRILNNASFVSNRLQTELENILGGIVYDNGTIVSAAVLRAVYTITAAAIDEKNEFIDPSREEWELSIAQKINDYFSFQNTVKTLVYNDAIFTFEFSNAVMGDVMLLGIGCALLLVYCAMALGKRDYVHSGLGLGLSALVTIGLCLLSAFGLAGAFEIMFTDFAQTLPFLVLGLGVDDSFIIVGEFQTQRKENPSRAAPYLMRQTMRHAGVSILITSLTDVLAFLIGATTVLPALNAFCLYAAFAVIFVFLFNVTFFSATVCVDHQRITQQRYDICCCVKAKHKHFMNPVSESAISQYLWCLHKIPNEMSKKVFQRIGESLTNFTLQITVCVIFVASIAVSLYWASFLEQDFSLEWFLPDSSALREFYQWRDDYFERTSSVFIYTTDIDYFGSKHQLLAAKDLLADADYLTGTLIDWHSEFWHYLNRTNRTQMINASNYATELKEYLFLSGEGFQYSAFIRFENETKPSQINGAFMIGEYKSEKVNNAANQVQAMDIIRRDTTHIMPDSKEMFAFSFEFLFWEQFSVIDRELYRNLGLAIAVVLLITLFLIPKLITAVLVLLTVFATIACVLGGMHLWHLTIDGVSVCYIIVAIGLSVDYSAHIGEAFMLSQKQNKEERVVDALYRIGSSVFNGGFSTFLAVLTMAFSETYIFRAFFKVFFLVCVFGLWHGLIVLPVLLLLFGPSTTLTQDTQNYQNGGSGEKTPLSISHTANHVPLTAI